MGGAVILESCHHQESFVRRGSTLYNVFFFPLVRDRRDYPNTTRSAPSSPAMAFRCLTDDGPTLHAGVVVVCDFKGIPTCIACNPYSSVIYKCVCVCRGGGPDLSGFAHV